MDLQLERFDLQPERTLGNLYVGDEWECYTLEDAVRPVKIYGKTAIPIGRFKLGLRDSPKFGKDVIWLLDVPDYEYVYIHAGNTERDTLGCILVGQVLYEESVGRSRAALDALRAKVIPVLRADGDCWIDVRLRSPRPSSTP